MFFFFFRKELLHALLYIIVSRCHVMLSFVGNSQNKKMIDHFPPVTRVLRSLKLDQIKT